MSGDTFFGPGGVWEVLPGNPTRTPLLWAPGPPNPGPLPPKIDFFGPEFLSRGKGSWKGKIGEGFSDLLGWTEFFGGDPSTGTRGGGGYPWGVKKVDFLHFSGSGPFY